jgi:hypothetical protein
MRFHREDRGMERGITADRLICGWNRSGNRGRGAVRDARVPIGTRLLSFRLTKEQRVPLLPPVESVLFGWIVLRRKQCHMFA